eukprot:scaffold92624_cov54-Phaeocystis_antarctica.AAC.2
MLVSGSSAPGGGKWPTPRPLLTWSSKLAAASPEKMKVSAGRHSRRTVHMIAPTSVHVPLASSPRLKASTRTSSRSSSAAAGWLTNGCSEAVPPRRMVCPSTMTAAFTAAADTAASRLTHSTFIARTRTSLVPAARRPPLPPPPPPPPPPPLPRPGAASPSCWKSACTAGQPQVRSSPALAPMS